MRLRDMQTAFASAMLGKAEDALLACIVSGDVGRGERLSVYRNNMHHNCGEALRAVYSVVAQLVGERFFRHTADRYMHRYPSVSGDIHRFGDHFPRFLLEFPPAAQLHYLPDVARLEWAMHEAFHAADHAPLALDRLQAISQAHYEAIRFALHPACRLLSSPYPVHAIWKANQPGAEWDGVLDIGDEGVSLLIRRDGDFMVEIVPLAAAEFSMLAALFRGQPLCAAYESALLADDAFDLARFMMRHVSESTLVDFHVDPPGGGQGHDAPVTKK